MTRPAVDKAIAYINSIYNKSCDAYDNDLRSKIYKTIKKSDGTPLNSLTAIYNYDCTLGIINELLKDNSVIYRFQAVSPTGKPVGPARSDPFKLPIKASDESGRFYMVDSCDIVIYLYVS